ncbi:hypothetical protein [Ruminococcus flavefaciens]|uniref:Uncharacterized protein n=1 Tax=Ruminococcus flavefaciens TaxID=1265 RepID=A0A315XUD6_RUMFL|nr:hypothetical protein [Ruminococcus flavefaciens]PWJ09963.1 hypothetical protein IE37_03257 [Ruminococcus flavefaciens]SSA52114.1 hypothetical protein SAMN02910325_03257 [Ruminococcus flavefaciens]
MGNSKAQRATLAVFVVLCMLLTACGNGTSSAEGTQSHFLKLGDSALCQHYFTPP